MAEIKGKGLPTRNTKGALGDIYVDTNTGIKYKCTGSYSISTHAESNKEYEWKPANSTFKNVQRTASEKPHETPKPQPTVKPIEKVEENTKETTNTQGFKKDVKSNDKHNYSKHFDKAKDAE